jgi:hypothetical protein
LIHEVQDRSHKERRIKTSNVLKAIEVKGRRVEEERMRVESMRRRLKVLREARL